MYPCSQCRQVAIACRVEQDNAVPSVPAGVCSAERRASPAVMALHQCRAGTCVQAHGFPL